MVSNEGSRRKRILFLTPQLPFPPEQGAAIRNYNLIAQVATSCEVDLLSFASDAGGNLGPLARLCRTIRTIPAPIWSPSQRLRVLLASRLPDMAHRLWSDAFASALAELLSVRHYDVVQIEGIEMAPYARTVRQQTSERGPRIVYDAHNAEYLLQRRACETDLRLPRRWPTAGYSLIQWRRLARFERKICLEADGVVAVSEADALALKALDGAVEPLVIPNGVDVERYHPGLEDTLPLRHPAIVFTGKMDFRPNVDAILWFQRQVWPLVKQGSPNATLYVVGKSPHRSLTVLKHDPQIVVTGYVEDILPYFGGADVYIVPLRIGGGTRLKVLEAMAAGLPLVSSRLGVEGIPLVHNEHALLADAPEAFAEAVVALLQDRDHAASLGQAARAFVVAHYAWPSLTPPLVGFYDRLTQAVRRSTR
jgi:glycosyltransferase involved in cell wall biosynthesis